LQSDHEVAFFILVGQSVSNTSEQPQNIFEDDATLIAKAREYLAFYQRCYEEADRTGDPSRLPKATAVAVELKISLEEAQELMEFAHSELFGTFERDFILAKNPSFVDHDGKPIHKEPDPFGFGE
jgi:hypothetical protein